MMNDFRGVPLHKGDAVAHVRPYRGSARVHLAIVAGFTDKRIQVLHQDAQGKLSDYPQNAQSKYVIKL